MGTLQGLVMQLQKAARDLGFHLFGIAPAVEPPGFDRLIDWIQAGHAAEMRYFADRLDAYRDVSHVLEGARSVIVLSYPYRTAIPRPAGPGQGRVARYAWGDADYHDIIHPLLKRLGATLAAAFPDETWRGTVDTAPLMEREFAQLAGLGWAGKNSLLLNKYEGSYFFLASLLTTASLPPSLPTASDHCGTCTRCLDACPSDAFVAPGVLDSARCISYQTIENRGVIPHELRVAIGDWLFGCDVCQDVCPWNRRGSESSEPRLEPRADHNPIDLIELLSLDEQAFRTRFRNTPLWRPRRRGLLRNAAICLGNSRDADAVPLLIERLDDPEPIVRGASAWALGEIGGGESKAGLERRLDVEREPEVIDELRLALNQTELKSS